MEMASECGQWPQEPRKNEWGFFTQLEQKKKFGYTDQRKKTPKRTALSFFILICAAREGVTLFGSDNYRIW
jgi:hypothetical protein